MLQPPQQFRATAWLMHFGKSVPAALPADSYLLLDEEERSRCERFKSENARIQYILAHATLRRLLSTQSPVAPEDWRFQRSAAGKPSITYPPATRLHFSLSHTDGLIACIASEAGPLGIDAERVRTDVCVDEFRKILSLEELARLNTLCSKDRGRAFYDIWTAKEAYTKALGSGLSESLQNISIHTTEKSIRLTENGVAAEDWAFYRLNAGDDFSVTAAVPPGVTIGVESFSTLDD